MAAHEHVFLTVEEAADLLRTSPRTLRKWTKEGKVPHVQGVGYKLLYNRAELLRLGTSDAPN